MHFFFLSSLFPRQQGCPFFFLGNHVASCHFFFSWALTLPLFFCIFLFLFLLDVIFLEHVFYLKFFFWVIALFCVVICHLKKKKINLTLFFNKGIWINLFKFIFSIPQFFHSQPNKKERKENFFYPPTIFYLPTFPPFQPNGSLVHIQHPNTL